MTATNTIERRRGYRQRIESTATLRPASSASSGKPAIVHVFDLSAVGVGFSAPAAYAIGQIFRFAMSDRRQSGSRVEICSCRARQDGMFDVGGQFC